MTTYFRGLFLSFTLCACVRVRSEGVRTSAVGGIQGGQALLCHGQPKRGR
jgi:hypothetical protein